jgi:phosphoribosylformylglycinamidine synthase
MGYDQVDSVRSGRFFELEINTKGEKDDKQIEEICSKLLSNPVIENYTLEYEK